MKSLVRELILKMIKIKTYFRLVHQTRCLHISIIHRGVLKPRKKCSISRYNNSNLRETVSTSYSSLIVPALQMLRHTLISLNPTINHRIKNFKPRLLRFPPNTQTFVDRIQIQKNQNLSKRISDLHKSSNMPKIINLIMTLHLSQIYPHSLQFTKLKLINHLCHPQTV